MLSMPIITWSALFKLQEGKFFQKGCKNKNALAITSGLCDCRHRVFSGESYVYAPQAQLTVDFTLEDSETPLRGPS
jgi:hypothetical protein